MILFVGAGPGDPELITVRGQKALGDADVIVYTGSLVRKAMLVWAKKDAEIHDSASLDLQEITRILIDAYRAKRKAVRLHTGDPSLFGAIAEQMRVLKNEHIPFRVIPGVSSFLASAAAIPAELTVPGISQTVIITRTEGRTAVPAGQSVAELASHRATMAVFLSADLGERTQNDLLQHYPPETAVVIVEKASWPEERVIPCRLDALAHTLSTSGIKKTTMILVGDSLRGEGENSRLYDCAFSHEYRSADMKKEKPHAG